MILVTTKWLNAVLINTTVHFFSEEHELQWSAPGALSDLTHFRKLIGKKGAESILRLSVDLFHPKIKQEEEVVDSTVQGKSISYHTDAKLAKKVIGTRREIANKENIALIQSYNPTAPGLLLQASNRESARLKKKALKATRRIRSIGGVMLRELLRKMKN